MLVLPVGLQLQRVPEQSLFRKARATIIARRREIDVQDDRAADERLREAFSRIAVWKANGQRAPHDLPLLAGHRGWHVEIVFRQPGRPIP
jgi:hypothetical protein